MIGNRSFLKKAAAAKMLAAVGVVTLGVGGTAAAVAGLPGSSGDEAPALVDEGSTDSSSSSDSSSTDGSSTDGSSTDESNHGQLVSDFVHSTELDGCEKGQATAELASGGRREAKDCGDESLTDDSSDDSSADDSGDDSSTDDSSTDDSSTDDSSADDSSTDGSSSDASNHGQVVSDFVHSTELEGCEKGQATAELASQGRHEAKDCGDGEESDDGSGGDSGEVTASEASPADSGHGKSDQAPGHSGNKPGNGNGNGNGKGHDD